VRLLTRLAAAEVLRRRMVFTYYRDFANLTTLYRLLRL